MDAAETIGVIGLGAMGTPIARRFLEAGLAVHGCDLSERRRDALVDAGGGAVERPVQLPAECSVFFVLLPNPVITEEALFGDGGLAEEGGPLGRGDAVVNLGTIGPDAIRDLGGRLGEQGVRFVDAPMGKSSKDAAEGTLALMVSGEEEVAQELRPLFERFATDITFCGELGVASTIKIVNNIVSASIVEVVAEGLALGVNAGAPLDLMFEVLSTTGADSWHLRNTFAQKVARGQFEAGFSIDLTAKDMKIGLDMAGDRQVPLPTIGQAYQRYVEAKAVGIGAEDWGAMAKLAERDARVELRLETEAEPPRP